MNTVTVTATRWEHGWELEIDPDHHTQVATLDKAEQQVRDYLDTDAPEVDHTGWSIVVVPDIGDLAADVAGAKKATEAASAASIAAARRARMVAQRLRASGYSVTDSAAILGVSRGRVSQLASGR
jgi:hypothetical protein